MRCSISNSSIINILLLGAFLFSLFHLLFLRRNKKKVGSTAANINRSPFTPLVFLPAPFWRRRWRTYAAERNISNGITCLFNRQSCAKKRPPKVDYTPFVQQASKGSPSSSSFHCISAWSVEWRALQLHASLLLLLPDPPTFTDQAAFSSRTCRVFW